MSDLARQGLEDIVVPDLATWIDDTYCYEPLEEYQERTMDCAE